MNFRSDQRFEGIQPIEKKVWLSSPTMHGEELMYITEAYRENWMSTVGENINKLEEMVAKYLDLPYVVAVSSGTAALHLAVRLAGKRLYGKPKLSHGVLEGHKVFCSDLTFGATVNPVAYEGGEAVFIDAEYDTWNMSPHALSRAFEIYPDVKLVVMAQLYGVPGKIDEIKEICRQHHALLIEDAAESLGADYNGKKTGTFGDYGILSFNGNKIITGSSGGMLLCKDGQEADQARKWSTQSREDALWYQHEEIGYNYRMSNVIAGVVRGQFSYLDEHIDAKAAIYKGYKEGLSKLPVVLNPYHTSRSVPNFWLSCMLIDEQAMCEMVRGDKNSLYITDKGKSCPTEILEALDAFRIEGRPIWKPMHMQPLYQRNDFIAEDNARDVGADIFRRGLCLPSDNKMTVAEQKVVMDIIERCFQ